MKKLLLCATALAVFIASCNNDKKVTHTEKNEDGTTTTTTLDVGDMGKGAEDMNKKMEELKTLKPLSLDELKALLPEEIAGIKRTSFNANSSMGFSVSQGEYKKDDSTEIDVAIYDGAGEMGAGMYGMMYLTKMNMQSESSDGYTKTIDFKGGKAVETYEKNNNQTTLTYLANDRLLIVITGKNVDNKALRGVAENLNLKV
ncbi:MAG: hypothetical protein ABR503_07840 [Chitinophagaceae bacterium]